jgi:adenosylcobinamide-phosphate synthase
MSVAAGLALGYAADAVFGDPRRWHPVAGFGRAAGSFERLVWRDSKAAGALYTGVCVGTATALGWTLGTSRRRWARAGISAAACWTVVGGRSLHREAGRIQAALDAGDVAEARRLLPALCGRDPAALDAGGIARATVESVAENTSDAVVAPLLWGGLAGPAGLLGYRAANTLDAMVGYRSRRYERFGWAAARLDDVANWIPARISGVLGSVLAPVVGGVRATAWRTMRRDGARHPSPNAGRVEAAFAGALGVRLGGRNVYGDRVEERPEMGDGAAPVSTDIARAVRLSRAVGLAAAGLAVGLAVVREDRRILGR